MAHDLTGKIAGIIGLASICAGIITILISFVFFSQMLTHVRPEKRKLLPVLGPLMLLMPELWDDVGNRARQKFIIALITFAVLFAIATLFAAS